MSKLLTFKIDVTKIDKARLFKGKKGTYLDAEVWINDQPDEYGYDGRIAMEQTKEEREAKTPKIFIGNVKKRFGWTEDSAPNKLLTLKIDVTKIDKARLFFGKKGTYLDAEVWINDQPDEYGYDGRIAMEQTKEEREAKTPKIFIGNAKKRFGWTEDSAPNKTKGPKPVKTQEAPPRYQGRQQDDAGEEIPF